MKFIDKFLKDGPLWQIFASYFSISFAIAFMLLDVFYALGHDEQAILKMYLKFASVAALAAGAVMTGYHIKSRKKAMFWESTNTLRRKLLNVSTLTEVKNLYSEDLKMLRKVATTHSQMEDLVELERVFEKIENCMIKNRDNGALSQDDPKIMGSHESPK